MRTVYVRTNASRCIKSIKTSVRGLLVAACLPTALLSPLRATAEHLQGRDLFVRCAACHLADGTGVPGSFPPLATRLGSLMAAPKAREYLVLVVQMGLMGDLQIDGSQYRGVMPAQGPGLRDEGVAAVLNYVLKQLNQKTLPVAWHGFSAAEVARIKAYYPNPSVAQLLQLRADVFGALKR
jgi:mono/diheme cytochrome c family protein